MTTSSHQQASHPLRLFVSYAAADRKIALEVRKSLSLQPHMEIFMPDDLNTGENWQLRLQQELQVCDVFIILLSAHALVSDWVSIELGAAWTLEKPIIPITTEPDFGWNLPVILRDIPLVSLEDFEKPHIVRKLLAQYQTKGAA